MFDTSTITEVLPPGREGSRLTLEWTSSAPAGTWFQVYIQGALAWWGTENHATLAAPRGLIDVQIGSVADGEQTTDFSSGLTPITTRAQLTWSGFGAAGYHIYEGGLGYDHGGYDLGGYDGSAATLVGNVVALEGGLSTDGYDLGGYDAGGYDAQGGTFTWTSNPLARGDWSFTVKPYDTAGNESTGTTTTVTITAPPRPPALNTSGKRLTCSYNATTHVATLTWLASPG